MRKRTLKRISLLILLSIFTHYALAVGAGFYLGLMFGTATSNAQPRNVQVERIPPFNPPVVTVLGKPRSNQYGTRFFLGYKMNPYFGFESGFTFFTPINYSIDNPLTNPLHFESCSSPNIILGTWDFLGRASLPFRDWFEIYGKAGAAVSYLKVSGSLRPDGRSECGTRTDSAKVRGTMSIGANYSLSQEWVVDLSWNRYLVGDVVGYMDFYAIGFAYHFVDRYCGQFLCDD